MLESIGDAGVQRLLVLGTVLLLLVAADTACYAAGRVVRTNRVRVHGGQMQRSMTRRLGFITGSRGTTIRFGYCDAGDSGHVDEARRARNSRIDEPVLFPRIDGQTSKHGWR